MALVDTTARDTADTRDTAAEGSALAEIEKAATAALNKAEDFPSKEKFKKQKADGVKRKLVGFVLESERRVPRHGYEIESRRGAKIGVVTSGTHSPTLDKPVGTGYVKTKFAEPGTKILIVAGGKKLEAVVSTVPFVEPGV